MTWQIQAVGDKATVLEQLADYGKNFTHEPDVDALVARDFVMAALKQTEDAEHHEVHYIVEGSGHRDRTQLSMNLTVRPVHLPKKPIKVSDTEPFHEVG